MFQVRDHVCEKSPVFDSDRNVLTGGGSINDDVNRRLDLQLDLETENRRGPGSSASSEHGSKKCNAGVFGTLPDRFTVPVMFLVHN